MNLYRKLLEDICLSNMSLLSLARKLNYQAGCLVVTVLGEDPNRLGREKVLAWITERLRGASSMQDFLAKGGTAEDLLFPEDAKLMQKLQSQYPEFIEVLGLQVVVQYRGSAQPPMVVLQQDILSNRQFQNLPDTGIHLPSGSPVAVAVACAYEVPRVGINDVGALLQLREGTTDMKLLKAQCIEALNASVWLAAQSRLPAVVVPTIAGTEDVPEVVEFEYGDCLVTGKKLVAYGSIVCNHSYWRRSIEACWTHNRKVAEDWRTVAIEMLPRLRQADKDEAASMAEARLQAEAREAGRKQQAAILVTVRQQQQASLAAKKGSLQERWHEAESLANELRYLLEVLTENLPAYSGMQEIREHLEPYAQRLQGDQGRYARPTPNRLNFNKPIVVQKWVEEAMKLLRGAYQAIAGGLEALQGFQEKLLEVVLGDDVPAGPAQDKALGALSALDPLLKQHRANEDAKAAGKPEKVKEVIRSAGEVLLQAARQAVLDACNPPLPENADASEAEIAAAEAEAPVES